MGDRIDVPNAFSEDEGGEYRDFLIASDEHPLIEAPTDEDLASLEGQGCAGVYVESDDPHYTMEGRDG